MATSTSPKRKIRGAWIAFWGVIVAALIGLLGVLVGTGVLGKDSAVADMQPSVRIDSVEWLDSLGHVQVNGHSVNAGGDDLRIRFFAGRTDGDGSYIAAEKSCPPADDGRILCQGWAGDPLEHGLKYDLVVAIMTSKQSDAIPADGYESTADIPHAKGAWATHAVTILRP